MITVGWFIGILIGASLGGGLLSVIGIAPSIAGLLTVIVGPLLPILAPFLPILSIPIAFLIGGMAIFVITIVAYALAAVSLGVPVAAVATNPIESINRGVIIGMTTAANSLILAALTGRPLLTTVVLLFGFLATIPAVSGNRAVFQPLLGLLSWVLPMTWVIMPVGVLLFVFNFPLALGQSGIGAIRFDVTTFTIETSGGALLNFIFSLGRAARGFNLGNFTFLRLAPGTALAAVQTSFTASGVSAHETGHTLTIAALGGFFGWINAVDENIAPLARGTLAYGEIIPESHYDARGRPFLAMW